MRRIRVWTRMRASNCRMEFRVVSPGKQYTGGNTTNVHLSNASRMRFDRLRLSATTNVRPKRQETE